MKATKQELITELRQLEKKYEMLVWFARKSSEQITTIEEVKNEPPIVVADMPDVVPDAPAAPDVPVPAVVATIAPVPVPK